MIEFTHVTKRYPKGQLALDDLSFHIRQGEMVFLTGHSGAGKSTFLNIITLRERKFEGEACVQKKKLSNLTRNKIAHFRRRIGIIFQDPMLILDKTVFANVALPLIIAGFNPYDVPRRVRTALDKVGLLHKEESYPDMLSAGEQQRVNIARAIVNKPAIILADEPTGNLDPALSKDVMTLFQHFNQVGTTVVIATHDIELIKYFDARQITLSKGKLIKDTGAVYA